jgi:hypothetical protein
MGRDVFLAMDLKPLISTLFNFTYLDLSEVGRDRKLGCMFVIFSKERLFEGENPCFLAPKTAKEEGTFSPSIPREGIWKGRAISC